MISLSFHLRALLAALLALGAGALPAPDAPIAPAIVRHGTFQELPVGAVKPRGWIRRWLERQAEGLTGHPENLADAYDTSLLAGEIPPPVVKHGETWWPYEQTGYVARPAVVFADVTDARVTDCAAAVVKTAPSSATP